MIKKNGENYIMGNQQPSLKIKPYSEDSQYLIYSDGRIYSNKSHKFLSGKISSTGYREYALAIGDKRSQNGKKLSKKSEIPPEAVIYASRNSPNNGWLMPLITSILTFVTTCLTLIGTIMNFS